jgi:hypothetical protein
VKYTYGSVGSMVATQHVLSATTSVTATGTEQGRTATGARLPAIVTRYVRGCTDPSRELWAAALNAL